jgi:catalase
VAKKFLKIVRRIFFALLLLLVLIVGSSWFYFEPHSRPKDEDQAIREITAVLTDIVEHQYEPLFFHRDTHAKSNACVKANFTIDPAVASDPRLNIGVFKGKVDGSRAYKAWMRFSNSANVVTDDREKDFRGLAIKLFDVAGEKLPVPSNAKEAQEKHTQDFLFIGHDAFFAGNAQHFLDFFSACRAGGYSCEPKSRPVIWHALTHPRSTYNAIVGQRTYRSIEDIRWFSATPYKLGGANAIVKYGAFPSDGAQSRYGDIGASPHYLTERLKESLDLAKGKGLKLDFKVQFREKPEKQPIDDALIAWEAKDSPWHKVATIEVFPQKFDSPEQWEFCQNITFNPWHSLVEHEPVGGINRARRDVMDALQKVRLAKNGRKRFEPTGNEVFNESF